MEAAPHHQWMEMDVVMHFSKKDGTKTEVHVNLASDPHEVARAYCIEHKMKLSLVPALAAIIRKRKEEALRKHDLEQQAELDVFTPTQSQKSPPPKPQRLSSGARGTAGLESPPSSGPSSPVSCPSSPKGANPFDMFPIDDTVTTMTAPPGVNPFDQIMDSRTTEQVEEAFSGFNRGRSTEKRQSSGIRQLKIQTEWGGMTPTPSPSSSSSSAAAGGGPSARSSSVPATTSSSLQFRRSSTGPASPATAATAGTSNFEDRDMSQDLGKTHHYLVGQHNYSPRQDDGYMPKMRGSQPAAAHRRSMSLSPPPPIKNQSSVDRLYSEHERMQARLRRLSTSVEDMKKAEISSTSFRNAVGFIASSPSVKVIQHSGKKEGQSHQEWLYYSGLKWTSIKDRQTQERARELDKQRDDHFRANATFHPQLSPSPLFSSSRAGGSHNKSVFEALYNSRTYYSDRVETLKKMASEEASKELIFSPKLENRQLTEKLAKKWREKEDLDQAKRRRRDNEQQQSSHVSARQENDDLLTLADLAQTSNPFDAILFHTDGDQPLQDNIVAASSSTSAATAAATLLTSTVEDTAPPDYHAAHLSFFDSFIQGDSPNVIVDTMGLEDIFSLQDLVIPIQKGSRSGNGQRSSDALFNRLHCHSSTKALEQAKKKHQPVFSHKPDIGKSSSTHTFISVEADQEKFFARLSRVYKKAEPPKKAPEKKIDSKSEANLVERMTVKYPKRSEKLRAQANSVHKKELEEAPNTVFTKPRSENLAKKVRRESLRVIFNLLLATVDYAREVEATKQDEGEGSWSVRKSAADDPVVGDGMLDTRRAISSLLHPKSLVRAIDKVLHKARPNPLSFDKFVLEIEALIFSGKCEPISAHLSAPDRSSWSEDWHVGREVEEPMHKPTLRARNVTEMMAKKRCRASRIDPRDYAIQREKKIAELRLRFQEDESRELTFKPSLPGTETFHLGLKHKKRSEKNGNQNMKIEQGAEGPAVSLPDLIPAPLPPTIDQSSVTTGPKAKTSADKSGVVDPSPAPVSSPPSISTPAPAPTVAPAPAHVPAPAPSMSAPIPAVSAPAPSCPVPAPAPAPTPASETATATATATAVHAPPSAPPSAPTPASNPAPAPVLLPDVEETITERTVPIGDSRDLSSAIDVFFAQLGSPPTKPPRGLSREATPASPVITGLEQISAAVTSPSPSVGGEQPIPSIRGGRRK